MRTKFPLLILALASLTSLTAQEVPAGPLPVSVMRNLHAGKPQTVVTYGTSLTHKGAWVGELDKWFQAQYPGLVTFKNTARSGMTSDWGVENLSLRVLEQKPNLVFIEFSANDAAIKHQISREKSEANLDEMVKGIRAQNPDADIVLLTMNPAWDSAKNPEKKYGGDRPELAAYYAIYRRYATDHGLPLVDTYPVWRKIQQEDPERFQKMVSDGIHPHSAPSVDVTWRAVEALLERARSAAGTGKPALP